MTDNNKTQGSAADYLSPTEFVQSDSPEVKAFTAAALKGLPEDAPDMDKAIRLFNAVRDNIRYDPYTVGLEREDYMASNIANSASGFCVPKAILLAACLRSVGIPAALGFADVRNHLNTKKLTEMMGCDLFIYHGYVQLWLDGKTYKVTPAFNMELCERFGVKPLLFDGTADALFHEFDQNDQRHMEYVNDRGLFVDFPYDSFIIDFRKTYPKLVKFAETEARAQREKIDDEFTAGG